MLAVGSILALLGLVVAGKMRDRTASAKCAGNLRSIGVLLTSYAADNNGYYPRDAYTKGYKGGGRRYAPEHFLLNYDGFTKGADGKIIQEAPPAPGSIFRCPSETSEKDSEDRPWFQSHYGFNFYLVHSTAEEASKPNSSNPYRRPLHAIANPSKVFLAGDARTRYSINAVLGDSMTLAFRNRGTKSCNILFVDGHVESLPPSAQNTSGGPAALGWDQYIEWGGADRSPGSPRY